MVISNFRYYFCTIIATKQSQSRSVQSQSRSDPIKIKLLLSDKNF